MSTRITIPFAAILLVVLMAGGYLLESRSNGGEQDQAGLSVPNPPMPARPGPFDDWGKPDERHLRAALDLLQSHDDLTDTVDLHVKYGDPGVPYPRALIDAMRSNVMEDKAAHELLAFALSNGPVAMTYPDDQMRGLAIAEDASSLGGAHYRLYEAIMLATVEGNNKRVAELMQLRWDLAYAHTQNPKLDELFRLNRQPAFLLTCIEQVLSRMTMPSVDLQNWLQWNEQFVLEEYQIRCLEGQVEVAQWRRDNHVVVSAFQDAHRARMIAHVRNSDTTLGDKIWLYEAVGKLAPEEGQPEYERDFNEISETFALFRNADQAILRTKLQELLTQEQQELPFNKLMRATIQTVLFARMNQSLMQAALRAELYRLEHGSWPTEPEALLATMPIDPWSGEPVRSKQTEHGMLIYSVGRNGTDDKGLGQNDWGPGHSETQNDDIAYMLLDPASRNKMPSEPEF